MESSEHSMKWIEAGRFNHSNLPSLGVSNLIRPSQAYADIIAFDTTRSWILTSACFVLFVILLYKFRAPRSRLDHIPAMGPTSFLLSYYGTFAHLRDCRKMVQEGFDKYQGAPFRVPMLDKWAVILCGQKYIEDIRQASRSDFAPGAIEVMQTDYTLGPDAFKDLYLIDVIRTPLYRNFPGRLPDIKDEICAAFEDLVPTRGKGWVPMNTAKVMQKIVCRSVNRVFVDTPLCRDKDYIDLMVNYTTKVGLSATTISALPSFLKPIIAPFLSPYKQSNAGAVKHLGSMIDDRMNADKEHGGGKWEGRPNDLISWLLDFAKGEERKTENLARRVLLANFASIHTTANVIAQALYRLVICPHYIDALRDEVQNVFGDEEWSYSALSKLVKLDSFLRECMRIEGPGQFLLMRTVINPNGFTFRDGTHLPCGTFLTGAAYAVHHDSQNYDNSDEFNGFRFVESEKSGGVRRLVQTDSTFLGFGYGANACPGRYFAAAQLKIIMAYILQTYDITGTMAPPPRNRWYGEHCLADPSYQVMLKERE